MVPEDVSSLLPSTREKMQLDGINPEVVGSNLLQQLSECYDFLYSNDSNCLTDDSITKRVQMLLDIAWEKLNTGHWTEAPTTWRYLYSYASLLRALTYVHSQRYRKAVRACDMGLLMGVPILDDVLSKVASVVCRRHYFPSEDPSSQTLSGTMSKRAKRCQVPSILHDVPRFYRPSLEQFLKEFVTPETPGIIRDAIEHWSALSKWSVGNLLNRFGWRTVPVEIGAKYTDDTWSQQLMTINEFVHEFIWNPSERKGGIVGYLAQHQIFRQIPELMEDIDIPTYCFLGEDDPDVNVWFGPEGTISPLHYDPKDNLLTQVFGEKYIRLYERRDTPSLYPYEGRLLHNTSQVDVEHPDESKFPLFLQAPFQECILKSGEMLYIPSGCWHYVRSLSASLSISFWWQSSKSQGAT